MKKFLNYTLPTVNRFHPRLEKLLKKYEHLIHEVSDLRCSGNGVWIVLRYDYDLAHWIGKDDGSILHEGFEHITNRHISVIEVHLRDAHEKWLKSLSAHELVQFKLSNNKLLTNNLQNNP